MSDEKRDTVEKVSAVLTMRLDMWLLYCLLRLFGVLPLRLLHAVGSLIGRLAYWCHGPMAHTVAVNLRLVRPDIDMAALKCLQRRVLIEAGKSIAEIVKIWGGGAKRSLKLVREVRGGEYFDTAVASGKGVIVAGPHLGCWELLNYWLCGRTPMAFLYRPPRLRILEPLLRRLRGVLPVQQIRADGAGVRALYKHLAMGGSVGILPDQKPRLGEGQFAPFFGRDAWTMTLLPRLAARTGATVLFAFAERLPSVGGYRIHFLPAPEGINDADKVRACAALNRGIEACVERAFTQYQWYYRRYSTQDQLNPYHLDGDAG